MYKGFTLVELSIVLVIIGLLIGGILIGQTMVEAAGVNSLVRQLSEFDSAVNAFESKYKQIPGDSKFHGGDGNGYLSGQFSDRYPDPYFNELSNFWSQAFPEKYAVGTYKSAPWVTEPIYITGANKNAPTPAYGRENSAFIAHGIHNYPEYGMWYSITRLEGVIEVQGATRIVGTNTAYDNRAMKPTQLAAIDKKIDDGYSQQGTVLSGVYGSADVRFQPSIISYNGNCSAAGALPRGYNMSNANYGCTPFFRIGGTTGNYR